MMIPVASNKWYFSVFILGVSLGLVLPSLSFGGAIEIEFVGVDVSYDGTNIMDADVSSADPDPLASVAITVDDLLVGTVLTSDISYDLFIPAVLEIPSTGGSVKSGGGGTLNIGLGAGNDLELTLHPVGVTYIDFDDAVKFAFGASIANVSSQNLPFGLTIGQEIGALFTTQIDTESLITSDGFVKGFSASGTGEVEGPSVPELTPFIPEPTGLVLFMLALAGVCSLVQRRK